MFRSFENITGLGAEGSTNSFVLRTWPLLCNYRDNPIMYQALQLLKTEPWMDGAEAVLIGLAINGISKVGMVPT